METVKTESDKTYDYPTPLIEFRCYELIGQYVFLDPTDPNMIALKEDIKVGSTIYVFGMLGEVVELKVTEVDGDKGSAENDYVLVPIEFGKDIRKSWVGCGMINKKVFDIIKFD